MDNLFETYKQIVDRAISLGLLSEENKSYYLSACEEESDSTCKAFNNHNVQVEHDQLKAISQRANNLSHSNSEEFVLQASPTREFNDIKILGDTNASCKDEKSVSGRSIENFSILDLNNFIKMANSIVSDSEPSDNFKATHNISSENFQAFKSNQVRKRPKKNEIVDFQIPIYLDISRKKMNAISSKGKRHFSFPNKARVNSELSLPQNEDEKEAQQENLMSRKTYKSCKSKQCLKVPKRINLADNERNASKLRRRFPNIYDPNFKCKYIKQNICETSSPRKTPKNTNSSGVVSTHHNFSCSKNRRDLETSMITNKSVTNTKVNFRNLDKKERLPKSFESFGERVKTGHESTLLRNSDPERFPLRSSVEINPKSNFRLLKSQENGISKYVNGWEHFEKPESPFDDLSVKESSDSETKENACQKLFNVNIICQFISNDSSEDKQDSSSLESSSQKEKNEDEKRNSIEPEVQLQKEKRTGRSKSNFLTKLFSRNSICKKIK